MIYLDLFGPTGLGYVAEAPTMKHESKWPIPETRRSMPQSSQCQCRFCNDARFGTASQRLFMQLSEHPTSPPWNPRGVHQCLHILRSEAEEVKIDGTSQARDLWNCHAHKVFVYHNDPCKLDSLRMDNGFGSHGSIDTFCYILFRWYWRSLFSPPLGRFGILVQCWEAATSRLCEILTYASAPLGERLREATMVNLLFQLLVQKLLAQEFSIV